MAGQKLTQPERELKGLRNRIEKLKPKEGSIPQVKGIDISWAGIPLYNIGGDHVVFLKFGGRFDLERRISEAKADGKQDVAEQLSLNYKRGGVYLIDVQGHDDADAIPAAELHQAFVACSHYELKLYGQITPEIFEVLNTRFYGTSGFDNKKSISGIYGEINESGRFRFISHGNCGLSVFSNEQDRIVSLPGFETTSPMGFKPSENHPDRARYDAPVGFKEPYVVNELVLLMPGDILVLYTDGLSELKSQSQEDYFPGRLEQKLREVKGLGAKAICSAIKEEVLAFNEDRGDDITYVVIKKKN